ncbi:phosphotransferase [Acidocella sp.]|uniref:phosphotransferase n=1 Tax=Acidocella sp. TaxID=50710 RepID=UPI002623919A|nr:phosphotransferase [Acidocella sp.]
MNEVMADQNLLEVEQLPFWTGPIKIWPLEGGTTNRNYGVLQADGQRFAVRLGQDRPEHGVMRFNEQAAARAAARAGISPKIYYTAPGVMVSRLLPGRSLNAQEMVKPENLLRVAALLRRCHTSMAAFLQGPLLSFWVFHVNRSYAHALTRAEGRIVNELPRLMEINDFLETRIGRVEIVFCHNDLLAGNVFDDGARLWLLDWDYAGFNAALFDLANLSSNNNLRREDDIALLEAYYGRPFERGEYDMFRAFKCASLLREALWNAISEFTSDIDHDYARATDEYLGRLNTALGDLD